MWIVFRKELADYFSSIRFLIPFCLVLCVALLTTYTVGMNLQSEIRSGAKFDTLFLMLFTTGGSSFP